MFIFSDHSLSHFVTKAKIPFIFSRSNSSICFGVKGGGGFFVFYNSFLTSGPLFVKFGDNFINVIPPYVSPNNNIGSL